MTEKAALLKRLLKEGEVEFTYIKADGTRRPAHGTMKADLLPKGDGVRWTKVKLTDIVWDADDPKALKRLPKACTAKVANIDEMSPDLIREDLGNWLSEKHCFCAKSFKYEKVAPKKLPEGQIFYYDLDKKGYRSFNESQLVEVKA